MANECLKQQLLGESTNMESPKITEIRFRANYPEKKYFRFLATGGAIPLRCMEPTAEIWRSDGTSIISGTNFGNTLADANSYLLALQPNGEHIAFISNKQRITKMYNISLFNLFDIKYCTNLEGIFGCSADIGCLEDIPSSVTEIELVGNNIVGDLSSIADKANINIQSTKITGDFSSLSANTSVSTLFLTSSYITGHISDILPCSNLVNVQLYGSSIEGSLSEFISNGSKVNPRLTTLIIYKCPNVTASDADITALQNLGVNVTFVKA